jgi:ABC-type phosphate transport system substrate-binding protein
MKSRAVYLAALVLMAVMSASPCFAHHMAVVVSKQGGVKALSSAQLQRIFRVETREWPDGTGIVLVLHRASAGEAATLARLNRMTVQEWQKWVANHNDSVKLVNSDEEVLTYVQNSPGAIGLVDVRSVNNAVTVVRVDGKVPMEAGYLPH